MIGTLRPFSVLLILTGSDVSESGTVLTVVDAHDADEARQKANTATVDHLNRSGLFDGHTFTDLLEEDGYIPVVIEGDLSRQVPRTEPCYILNARD